ncbi:hypothetical protein [Oribacterium sp. WCC10]|uniref:hypothetical protein n=1 Tax=Oribacterium sp. WCC10 TaxID=1855343 RepID=UPI0008E1CAE1|nr:hypothetical protein [Oribacterium sp. WCC10]SFG51088.1 hypothetical protein SAMN05216356_11140 [Oribacterium sp. WCC10]
MLNIFDKKSDETIKDDSASRNVTASNQENSMELCSLERRLLCSFDSHSTITTRDDGPTKTLIMSVTTRKDGDNEVTDFLSCEYTSQDNKTEIEKMMEVLSSDLQKSRNKGAKFFVVPQTGLDLYAYIKARPSIEIDMDDLANEIRNSTTKKLRTDFIKNIQVGKKVNIFIAKNSLYNQIAYDMLKAAYTNYANVHFFEIEPEKTGDPITWQNNSIGSYLSIYRSVINIGVGVEGPEPSYTLPLVQTEDKSVISQTASLLMNPLNAREELLEAQAVGHAREMIRVGQKRSLSMEVIEKAIRDMAKEAALYRYDENGWNEFETMAVKSKRIENGLCIVRLPFNDPTLIKNYFTEAHTGLLAIIRDKELYYYGESETVYLLSEEYGWTAKERDIAHKVFDNREAIYELSDMTTKREFIKTINTAIENRSSLRQTYDSISKISKRFNETMGIDMEGQFKLLKYVDAIKDDETRMKSIRRIITETLTPRSPFNPFGELFNHNFFN